MSNSIAKFFVLSVKMNEIVNTFLLAGHTFMPEIHLKQPGFNYSAYYRKIYVDWKYRYGL